MLHLSRNHSEAASGVTAARRFDRRIECEQIALARNLADQLENGVGGVDFIAELLDTGPQRRDGARRGHRHLLRYMRIAADDPDGIGQFLGVAGHIENRVDRIFR